MQPYTHPYMYLPIYYQYTRYCFHYYKHHYLKLKCIFFIKLQHTVFVLRQAKCASVVYKLEIVMSIT